MTIFGLLDNLKQATLDKPSIAQAYEPFFQVPDGFAGTTIVGVFRTVNLVVRSQRDPDSVIVSVRNEVQRLDPALPLTGARPFADVIAESVKPQRFSMTVVGLFAL